MDRREFLKRSTVVGVSVPFGSSLAGKALETGRGRPPIQEAPDLAVVRGGDYFACTTRAVEILGGMESVVSRGATVCLLVNSPWSNPGTFTNPDVTLAALSLCLEAGSGEVSSVEGARGSYWTRSGLASRFSDAIASVRPPGGKDARVSIQGGVTLREATVSRALMECDVLINVPILKDHSGTRFTCSLKNMMGACHSDTNRFFHFGSGGEDWYSDVNHLSQCIADVNLVRHPDLVVVDATEFVVTNGPAGPGRLQRARTVVVGKDPVAVDAYCSELLGLRREDVAMIGMARENGLGEMDPSAVRVHVEDLDG